MSWLKGIFSSFIALFAPIHVVLGVVLLLVLTDLLFGVVAAKKRGEKITSAGLRRTVSKIFVYEFVIGCAFLFQTYLLGIPGDWVVKLIGGVIGVVEMKSLLEKANDILGNELFKIVIQKLGSKNDSSIEEKEKNKSK